MFSEESCRLLTCLKNSVLSTSVPYLCVCACLNVVFSFLRLPPGKTTRNTTVLLLWFLFLCTQDTVYLDAFLILMFEHSMYNTGDIVFFRRKAGVVLCFIGDCFSFVVFFSTSQTEEELGHEAWNRCSRDIDSRY